MTEYQMTSRIVNMATFPKFLDEMVRTYILSDIRLAVPRDIHVRLSTADAIQNSDSE